MKVLVADKISPKGVAYLRQQPGLEVVAAADIDPDIDVDGLASVEIRHGICNPDGSPRRYYSKTEIKRAANEKGLVLVGDTPGKPYKVNWSGHVRKNVGS